MSEPPLNFTTSRSVVAKKMKSICGNTKTTISSATAKYRRKLVEMSKLPLEFCVRM
jgi:hypothetical protein